MERMNRRVGPYLILGRLGAGGMGEVYLARDPRLERDVALKMLPVEVARDHERMALFRKEALALAAVNHPNIATIFGFEETDTGTLVLVLERVEGITLAARLASGAMPPAEALQVCAQVAEALEAAHARGVIHRDLKPGNIMVSSRGKVKVLDFGLASHVARSTDASPARTQVTDALHEGPADETAIAGDPSSHSISGTPSYMSPEQIQGLPQDERTDVFAFGCVLYECFTGTRCFHGDSVRDVWNSILHATPDWNRLPLATPGRIRKLLEHSLERSSDQRLASMHEARIEIEETLGIRRTASLSRDEQAAGRLPLQSTSFVARKGAIEDCLGLFETARLLTITGVGGVGKTRLAIRLAEMLVSEFPDGVWFVDLAPVTDPERVPKTVANVLGISEEPSVPLAQAIGRHLTSRRALIVLDNCEHLLGACAELVHSLIAAVPGVKVIATSREGMSIPGESTYAVPSMSLPDTRQSHDIEAIRATEAAQLFVERAVLARPEFVLDDKEAPAVVEICRQLDGIPLAIELAAARIRVLSAQQILAKLHDRFRLLAGGKAAVPRHQTLRASIQWSYDQLTPDEQRLLRLVSVFAGGWTLEAVTACGDNWDEFEVLDLLTRLVEKSLVVVERHDGEETRYRCLETVRQFGAELLLESGEIREARSRHRDWAVAFATRMRPLRSDPDQARWFRRMEAEVDNMRVALESFREDPHGGASGLKLAAAIEWFWAVRGYFNEGRRWIAEILERGPFPPSPDLGNVLMGAGNMAWRQDDLEEARRYYLQALEVRRKIGDEAQTAGALGSLGNVAQSRGDWLEARSLFEQALEITRRTGNLVWTGTSLTCLGNVTRYLGEFEIARKYLEEAISVTHEVGNVIGEAMALQILGDLMTDLGELEAAGSNLERAMALHEEIDDPYSKATNHISMAALALRRGDSATARTLIEKGLRVFLDLGGRMHMAEGLEDLAGLLLLEGNAVQAARVLGNAKEQRDLAQTPIPPMRASALERTIAGVRESLGEERYATQWEYGRRLTPERAIEEVFGTK